MRLGDRGAVRAVGAPNLRIWVCRPRGAGCARLFALLAAQNRPPQSRGRSMTAATWTAERIEQLRNFVVTGLTCSQIAAEIGVTRNAVIGKIHRLGLSPARPAGAPARSSPPRVRVPAVFAAKPALSLDRRASALHRRRAGADRQRTALLAARDRARQVPLADRRSACRGLCLLRQRGDFRILILRRSRPHGLSGPGAAARLTRANRTAPRETRRRYQTCSAFVSNTPDSSSSSPSNKDVAEHCTT
jgi:hypothetical protein